jgi:hypothetical protein
MELTDIAAVLQSITERLDRFDANQQHLETNIRLYVDQHVAERVSCIEDNLVHRADHAHSPDTISTTPDPEHKPTSTSSSDSRNEPKIPLPEKYNGDRDSFKDFMSQLELVFFTKSGMYATDNAKIGLLGSLLTGKARKWLTPLLTNREKHADKFATYAAFKAHLYDTFADPNAKHMAAMKIHALLQQPNPKDPQSKMSIWNYYTEFQQLAAELDWGEKALISQFYRGLCTAIKDALVFHPRPSTMSEMVQLCIELDNRQMERDAEKNAQTTSLRPYYNDRHPNSSTSTDNTTPPKYEGQPSVPMEIGVTKRREGFSFEERQRRRELNLCAYCGEKEHKVDACPNLRKARFDKRH